jgi:mannosyltransferase OCH1-like enzyme
MGIPEIFIQTSKKPPNFYRVAKIKEYCHNWEYQHYVDEDIINFFRQNPDNQFPDIEEKFNNFTLGQHKADLFRYYYLYKKGGVYMDTDCMLYINIYDIIQNYRFVSVQSNKDMAFNGFIATVPNHVIMLRALHHMYHFPINSPTEPPPYHTFCTQFMKIIKQHKDDTVYLLQEHINENNSEIKTIDGIHMLTHYYKTKKFPVTFMTKSNDHGP